MDLSREETGSGLKAAIAAYTAWGLLPVYWKQMGNVPFLGILSHRILHQPPGDCLLRLPGSHTAPGD